MKKITIIISESTYRTIADIQHALVKEKTEKQSQGDAVDFIADQYRMVVGDPVLGQRLRKVVRK